VSPDEALAATVRQEWGRLVALLLAQFRRLDLVEDALADAVESAARTWQRDGVPARPAAWLTTAARRRVVDRLRAEAMALRKQPLIVMDERSSGMRSAMADPGDLVEDDVLRLVLMCCHPALAPEVASALWSGCRPPTSLASFSCPSRRWPPASPGGSARS
jgi:predicted RNA polymerase sigma factor